MLLGKEQLFKKDFRHKSWWT